MICAHCRTEFTPSRARLYCTKACARAVDRLRKQRAKPLQRACVHCGKTFEVGASERSRKYCGKECARLAHGGRPRNKEMTPAEVDALLTRDVMRDTLPAWEKKALAAGRA